MTKEQRSINPMFDADKIGDKEGVYRTYRLDRISKATKMDGTPMPFGYTHVKANYLPDGVPDVAEKYGQEAGNGAESGRANQSEYSASQQDIGATPRAIPARELVSILSPNRTPPQYGQVFQSAGEIARQKRELRAWAESNGRMVDAELFRRESTERGGGEEHEVLFSDGDSVIKITRPDSWAAGATPAQYFQRWKDIGILFPALEPEFVGVSGDSIITRQRFIDGEVYKDRSKLETDMKKEGWERIAPNRFKHESGAVISDARPSNIIKGMDGRLYPFDVVVESIGTNAP